jgi:hypothetical protein
MADHLSTRPLSQVLSMLSYIARKDNRPPPVIETDIATAHDLQRMLKSEFDPVHMKGVSDTERDVGVVAIFDGIKIKGKIR